LIGANTVPSFIPYELPAAQRFKTAKENLKKKAKEMKMDSGPY
jgi:hypothetical protein